MENSNQSNYYCRSILACGETGGSIDDEIEKGKKERKENKEKISDSFPVWKKTQHKRSNHPGFC